MGLPNLALVEDRHASPPFQGTDWIESIRSSLKAAQVRVVPSFADVPADCELVLVSRNMVCGSHPEESGAIPELQNLIGRSPAFLAAVARIPVISRGDATVILSGETGTGKGLFARAIHYLSARKAKPFLPVNCGALPDQLFENEMFGHEKEAFTDAREARPGLLAGAKGGTIFLDEVDSLSLPAQAKLLCFLQDKEYRPLGGTRSRPAEVRVIAASNTPLLKKVREGAFREDLYHRLNVLSIEIPPLRARPEDIPLLAKHFLRIFCEQYGRTQPALPPAAVRRLAAYSWPGNVRELESMIHRAVILCPSQILSPDDFLPSSTADPEEESDCWATQKKKVVDQMELAYLTGLLEQHGGNVTRAARAAGKERRAFQRLIRKHRLNRRDFCPPDRE